MTRPSPTNGLPDRGSRRPLSIRDDGEELLHGALGVIEGLDPDDPRALELLLGHLIRHLPEPHRSAVEMTMRGISYEEAAGLLAHELGRRPHKAQVWRWAGYGRRQLLEWLEGTPWVGVLMRDRIPLGRVPGVDAEDGAADDQEENSDG